MARHSVRGFGLIEMAIWGVVIAGVLTAGAVWWHGFTESYREEGRKELRPQLEAAQADAASAKAGSDAQNLALAKAQELQKAAEKAAGEQAIKYAKAVAERDAKARELRAIAATKPPEGRSCPAVLDATTQILRESLRARAASDTVQP